ncbi:universal stress protein [Rossellomorea vietnamensis]|uniref:Universal stress protein n=1 Tax=Rossellomorea vietnamensis TaxID=218284 RepID=A0A5D4P116_9BACI|nr:universal stress protein [Rossellomorea vietnamensis]TYS19749.1 universal stress protein [Rossellomorea vietnamensis]
MTLKYKNILVAVDGSKEAEWAFTKSIDIALRNEAKISILHVIDARSFATVESYEQSVGDRADQYAKELIESYKEQAHQAGVTNVDTLIEYGSPKVIIPKDGAEKVSADLIVCGATGLSAMERFLIGSVSEHITRSAKCDVLVVRTDDQ